MTVGITTTGTRMADVMDARCRASWRARNQDGEVRAGTSDVHARTFRTMPPLCGLDGFRMSMATTSASATTHCMTGIRS
ncbi:hypothetical protein C5C03_00045 [Clavibacter michiganensis]|nr:hypothetical protein C5C03_00045 [Clavibacter michiganensis]PPF99297.1 hypothetical protein C5C05_01850 [Clavibacter michiganensis]